MRALVLVAVVACGDAAPSWLVVTADEPPGPNCANGGLVVESGRDIDDSGTLTPDEITSSSYVCQPSPPAPPASQLVDVVTVPPGANCANGGQAIRPESI